MFIIIFLCLYLVYMLYRVILTKNGEYKKTLHRCKTRETSFLNFNRIERANNVLFERKYVNYGGIKPVKYKIYVVKDYEETDTLRIIRDKLGRLVTEKPLYGIWTVLNDADYKIEETFWVYGFSPYERKNINDIVRILMTGIGDQKSTKQVVVVHNKLIFHNEDMFDMVICKCKADAQRLHHALAGAAVKNKISNLFFMGTARKKMVSDYYDIIHENTKWPYTKIRRTTTRP